MLYASSVRFHPLDLRRLRRVLTRMLKGLPGLSVARMSTALALGGAKTAVYPARIRRYKTQCSPISPICLLVAIYCHPPLRFLIVSVYGSKSIPLSDRPEATVGAGDVRWVPYEEAREGQIIPAGSLS